MRNRLANFYNSVILGMPRITLLVLACVFVFFSFYVKDFHLDASTDSLLLQNDKDLRKFREVNDRYKTQDYVFVTFTPNADLFSDGSLNTIKEMRDDFRKLDTVDHVLTLVDVPLVKIVGGSLVDVAKNYKTLLDKDIDRAKAKQELLSSPLFVEQVISKDGKTTALIIYFRQDKEFEKLKNERNRLEIKRIEKSLTGEEEQELHEINSQYEVKKELNNAKNHKVIKDIRAIMKKYRDKGQLYVGGVPMIVDDMISYIKNDLVIFGAGIFGFMVVMLWIIFRQVRWIVLPLLNCIYSVTLMMGLLGLIGWKVTVISSNFISLMLIVTMSMNVHLIVRYRQLMRDEPFLNQRQLVFDTARKMVWPCLYTALTTMMGFGSLVVSDIKPVIDFGWMMTLGLAVAFLVSFLLFPSILVLLKKTPGNSTEKDEVPFTAFLARLTERHGNKIIVVALVLALVTGYGITKLKVENSFVNYFSENTEIYKGLKLIDDKLGGTASLDIILKLDDGGAPHAAEKDDELNDMFGGIEVDKADYWFTPEKINLIEEVHDYLASLPAVGKVLSLASTIRVAESLTKGGKFDTFLLGVIYKQMPKELRDQMITPYVNIDNDEARINLRVKDSRKDLRRKELLEKIHHDLVQKFHIPEDKLEITGLLVLYNNMLQSLFKSQILTLGVVMIGIAFMLLVLFQSFSLAIIGIIPNILSAAIILGLMGLLNIPLDMMTITIASISIGIAVDNAIHYIYRFREEYSRNGDYLLTLQYCHANIGRAVFYTAITIIVGFSILVMSNFIPTIYFGMLTAVVMVIALFAALTLLPKLILLWKPF